MRGSRWLWEKGGGGGGCDGMGIGDRGGQRMGLGEKKA